MNWFHLSVLQLSIIVAGFVAVLGALFLTIWRLRKRSAPPNMPVPTRTGFRSTAVPPSTAVPAVNRSAPVSLTASPAPVKQSHQRRFRRRHTGLTAGSQLGDGGGQGTVHDVPGHPELVIKTFDQRVPGAVSLFEQIIEFGPGMRDAVGSGIDLCWPLEPRGTGLTLEGYVMPRLKPEFYFDIPNARRTTRRERSLDWAVRTAAGFQVPFSTTDADRLELLRLFTRWLGAMHERQLVYGDISWKNFSFSVAPVRLAVYDFDQTRVVGVASFTRRRPAETVDWEDASAPIGPATLDTDRYKYALLAFRLLVSRDLGSRLDENAVPAKLPGFDLVQTARMRALWRRAAGRWGTRPTVAEWAAVLRV